MAERIAWKIQTNQSGGSITENPALCFLLLPILRELAPFLCLKMAHHHILILGPLEGKIVKEAPDP